MSALSSQYDVFRSAVEVVINKWTGLRLAVENGMGGSSGLNTARAMIDYIAKFSYNDDVDGNDIAEALEDIMEQEFCTYLEDDSPKEIGCVLKRYKKICTEGNLTDLETELSHLPPGPLWLKDGLLHKAISKESSDSEDENEEMDEDMPAVASTSGGTTNMTEANLDNEWTQVKSRRKRG